MRRGLDQTVTHGIISAKHRRGITEPSRYQDFLQTDAAITPGNSGCPLLNVHGEVVGVDAVIALQAGGLEGIGFAIPSNMAAYVAKALITHSKIAPAWLGVSVLRAWQSCCLWSLSCNCSSVLPYRHLTTVVGTRVTSR